MSSIDNSTFLEKRSSLQSFVREQLIGPGAFNRKYFLLSKWHGHEYEGKRISNCYAIDNCSEIISEVPAYQYSSAILFPTVNLQEASTEQEQEPIKASIEEPDPDNIAGDDEYSQDKSESVSSKNQNYPNTLGLSIAVGHNCRVSSEVSINVSFRTYEHLPQKELSTLMLGHWIQFDELEISQLIDNYMGEIFRVAERDGNHFVLAAEHVDLNDHLYTIDYLYLERILSSTVLPLIGLLYPHGEFFRANKSSYGGQEYDHHLVFEESLLSQLRSDLRDHPENSEQIIALLEALERYNRIKSITTELKTIYRKPSFKNRPTPVWAATNHCLPICLPEPVNRIGIIRDNIVVDADRGLHLNYQYLFHPTGLLYIKLILVNRNKLELGQDEPPQLNKKDRANELSCFGVELRVQENQPGILQPYNPPNLISIDEEDNFNKTLYRDYKDFGEGYNTSVAWGVTDEEIKLRYVHTEFLPEEDTPDVDFEPTKVQANQIVKLIDSGALSMRSLSTLSAQSDAEMKKSLNAFADAYGTWIAGEEKELDLEKSLDEKHSHLLKKQLRGCELDFRRLKRNLVLLFREPKALAAFRVMNTAMYMQLEHSSGIKALGTGSQKAYFPGNNSPSYYQSCERDYQWRSFQLAFILLNLDGFIKPENDDHTVEDVFGTGWPERNEIADLVWFPTGGGKTEAYLGIIGFCIAYRRFTQSSPAEGGGTTVLMRYTLRLLTLQQFQRATLLICAMEAIRKDGYPIIGGFSLGTARITIGLFVGGKSLPNTWKEMADELSEIIDQLKASPGLEKPKTRLPLTECPWCGGPLFNMAKPTNLSHLPNDKYKAKDAFILMCNTQGCTFHANWPNDQKSIPILIFDEDIYKHPPTLLFGTVDKFAALANNVEVAPAGRAKDSQRFFGKGSQQGHLPPSLIIQDELHLLLGPLGSAVGLFEKAVDECCTIRKEDGTIIRPKIITSTATTRNTDKQIFALFNRRSEIFPKQGIKSDDSFFARYRRDEVDPKVLVSKRRYIGVLPVGKTQVWMQLRIASIALAHRVKYIRETMGTRSVLQRDAIYKIQEEAMNYYHTVLSYFNSLKEVGKTQSQLTHYLPSDLDLVLNNTIGWSAIGKFIRPSADIQDGELTGRLNGEEVRSNLSRIQLRWDISAKVQPPEFVISTNMISVGIDVSRFNIMIINSMPRNVAEYIQASSRVARDKPGIVFTVHHPFRSRDLSHYQRFKEFHEKFYSYVEPISVTPFADKALERYFAMFLAVMIRHDQKLTYQNNEDAAGLTSADTELIKHRIMGYIQEIHNNSAKLNEFLSERDYGVPTRIEGIIDAQELISISAKIDDLLLTRWLHRLEGLKNEFRFRHQVATKALFSEGIESDQQHWNVKYSLREIAPTVVIKTVQQ